MSLFFLHLYGLLLLYLTATQLLQVRIEISLQELYRLRVIPEVPIQILIKTNMLLLSNGKNAKFNYFATTMSSFSFFLFIF